MKLLMSYLKSLTLYEKEYGKDHISTSWIFRDLGQIALLKDQLENAEHLLNKALTIFQQSQHSESYTVLEDLTELYLKKSIQAVNKENTALSRNLKKQAIHYSQQALEIVKTYFSENSPHAQRIQLKLQTLETL